jgi:hypothetical protein
MKSNYYDKIIIGAGLYGLYAAYLSGLKNQKVLVVEYEDAPFKRATHVNQARVHLGYHYPRSISTAIKSRSYYNRFVNEFKDSINDTFTKIYATSNSFSWTNSKQFQKFCTDAELPYEITDPNLYFKANMIDGAFITKESSYDFHILKLDLLEKIGKMSNVKIICQFRFDSIHKNESSYLIHETNGTYYETSFLINATYASLNQIHKHLNLPFIKIKYELCEVILTKVSSNLSNIGITVMDGPFFSLMPFGKSGLHSLTSVNFTPRLTSLDPLPRFSCQNESNGMCSHNQLDNCNTCPLKPKTAWKSMEKIASKYLNDTIKIDYVNSIYSMKTVLVNSEVDDSRPTLIKIYSNNPTFISILSGKINTIYDLEELL